MRVQAQNRLGLLSGSPAPRRAVCGSAVCSGTGSARGGSRGAARRSLTDRAHYDSCDRSSGGSSYAYGRHADRSDSARSRSACSTGCRGIYCVGDVHGRSRRGRGGRRIVVNRRFLAGMQRHAVSGQIANLASSLKTDDIHLRGGGIENHRHFGADHARYAHRGAYAEM